MVLNILGDSIRTILPFTVLQTCACPSCFSPFWKMYSEASWKRSIILVLIAQRPDLVNIREVCIDFTILRRKCTMDSLECWSRNRMSTQYNYCNGRMEERSEQISSNFSFFHQDGSLFLHDSTLYSVFNDSGISPVFFHLKLFNVDLWFRCFYSFISNRK